MPLQYETSMLYRNHLFVAERRWKLASHAVAGNLSVAPRPEGTLGTMNLSVVPSGQCYRTLPDQPPCGWLISLCRFATCEMFLQTKLREIWGISCMLIREWR